MSFKRRSTDWRPWHGPVTLILIVLACLLFMTAFYGLLVMAIT